MKMVKLPKQKLVLDTNNVDVIIYGGSAGGGKSYCFFLDFYNNYKLLHDDYVIKKRKSHTTYFFRKTYQDSKQLFKKFIVFVNQYIYKPNKWFFDKKKMVLNINRKDNLIYFSDNTEDIHMEVNFSNMDTRFEDKHQGIECDCFYVDEATQDHFTIDCFNFLKTRLRNPDNNLKKYIFLTCNPKKNHWLRKFLNWYIDKKKGTILPERDCRIIFWFQRGETILYDVDKNKLENKVRTTFSIFKKSKTLPIMNMKFIQSTLDDNPYLNETDDYRNNLLNQSEYNRQIFLEGNWNAIEEKSSIFKSQYFKFKKKFPVSDNFIRYYDFASTIPHKKNKDPDYTATCKGCFVNDKFYIQFDRIREEWEGVWRFITKNVYEDGSNCKVVYEEEGGNKNFGSILKNDISNLGIEVEADRPDKSKELRAMPMSASFKQGNIYIIGNEEDLDEEIAEICNFPHSAHDDLVDAMTGCYNQLTKQNREIYNPDYTFGGAY